MLAMVNNSNCVQFLVRAHLCKSGILEEASLKVLVMNKAKVKDSEDWREMKKNYPQLAMDVLEKLMKGNAEVGMPVMVTPLFKDGFRSRV
jgi:hypothetical protein